MTVSVLAPAAPASAVGRLGAVVRSGLPFAASLLVFALCRPFQGVAGDGIIYLTRALADLDPDGVGHDMMFVYDGQSGFSIFRFVAAGLVAALGPAGAAALLAVVDGLAWLGGLTVLARGLAGRRSAWLVPFVVAALPLGYGAFDLLQAGETLATPRPLAEALVLLALAACLHRRRALAAGCLALAAALHPIMALAGVAVAPVLVVRLRSLLVAICVGVLAVVAATALHLPLFDRATTIVDPAWQALLVERHPYLFPTLWPLDTFARTILSVATIYIAGRFASGPPKRLLLGAALVGPLGILASAIFGDGMSVLLVEQMQLWRLEWLTSTIGAASLALCVLHLWPRGHFARLALALLCLGWTLDPDRAVAAAAGALAVLLVELDRRAAFRVDARVTSLLLALLASALVGVKGAQLVDLAGSGAAAAHPVLAALSNVHAVAVPVLAIAMLTVGRGRTPRPALAATLLLAALGLGLFWDARSPRQRALEERAPVDTLLALVAAYPGAVLWPGGAEPWYLLGRPSWAYQVQGAGGVFSRRLTFLFHDRMTALVAAGLAPATVLAPFKPAQTFASPQLTQGGVAAICARADAPAWIVMPLPPGLSPPAGVVAHAWRPPWPSPTVRLVDGAPVWQDIQGYTVLACAEQPASRS